MTWQIHEKSALKKHKLSPYQPINNQLIKRKVHAFTTLYLHLLACPPLRKRNQTANTNSNWQKNRINGTFNIVIYSFIFILYIYIYIYIYIDDTKGGSRRLPCYYGNGSQCVLRPCESCRYVTVCYLHYIHAFVHRSHVLFWVCLQSELGGERKRERLYTYITVGAPLQCLMDSILNRSNKNRLFFPTEASLRSNVCVSPSIVTATYETQFIRLLAPTSVSIICQRESGYHSHNLCVAHPHDKLRCASKTSRILSVRNWFLTQKSCRLSASISFDYAG